MLLAKVHLREGYQELTDNQDVDTPKSCVFRYLALLIQARFVLVDLLQFFHEVQLV
ncbi:MAG: hypothetical protein ACJAVV_001300 [Alphaproteobacteria bacterium]|jgi:hypothetical protein